jgi:hypothetical protein
MMKKIAFIVECCLVLILRNGEWNELTGYPKDRGKNRLNLRMNSLQPRENDADLMKLAEDFVRTAYVYFSLFMLSIVPV